MFVILINKQYTLFKTRADVPDSVVMRSVMDLSLHGTFYIVHVGRIHF